MFPTDIGTIQVTQLLLSVTLVIVLTELPLYSVEMTEIGAVLQMFFVKRVVRIDITIPIPDVCYKFLCTWVTVFVVAKV